MINDLQALADLASERDALRRLQGKMQVYFTASFARGAWFLPQVADPFYALLLPFGFSVLEHVLSQMRDDALFVSRSSQLGALMSGSKLIIPWADYLAIDAGREIRNKLTHEQVVPSNHTTFRLIDEIERELIGWKVLNGPVKYEFSLTFKPDT